MQGLCSLSKFNGFTMDLQTSLLLDFCWLQRCILCRLLYNYWNHTSWLCCIWRAAYWGEVVSGWKDSPD